ncbi:MAG: helix-turn-helix domain-containing protein [Actinomycetia bacterium]|nr:helix-turn-helix domain-containing protein [Actinomycetes bacterium]
MKRNIVIVAFPGMQSLDVVGPFEVFAGASKAVDEHKSRSSAGYTVSLVSPSARLVASESGLALATSPLPRGAIDTLLLPGGTGVFDAQHDDALIAWIAATAPRCRRIATVCTGTFLAAQAGLLDGRTVTTHWARAARLQSEFPHLRVDPDPIYLRDGNLWTSAGVTAGIDLALALVEDDHGTAVAQTVARWLVMFLHRPGGQTQFAAPVWAPRAERSTVRATQALVEAAPGGEHSVPALAAAAAMSVRHFSRVFTDEVGESPGRYVERVRLEAARRELETTGDTLDVIATRCGFGTAETMRRSFHRRLGVAPDSYRRRFRAVS